MKKLLVPAALLLVTLAFGLSNQTDFAVAKAEEIVNPYLDDFNYVTTSNGLEVENVKNSSLNKTNLRIYSYHEGEQKDIIGIKENAFSGVTNLTSIMIGKGVINITDSSLNFNSNVTIYYTGSLAEWTSLKLCITNQVVEYSFDEGFINYWNEFVRPTDSSSVCDISKDTYQILKAKYDSLGTFDRENVYKYVDSAGESIEESMEYLDAYFNPKPVEDQKEKKIPKDIALTIVIGIAVFGMTSIAIFYLLMKKNIIS